MPTVYILFPSPGKKLCTFWDEQSHWDFEATMVNSTLCKTLVSKFETKTSKNLSLHDAKLPSQK